MVLENAWSIWARPEGHFVNLRSNVPEIHQRSNLNALDLQTIQTPLMFKYHLAQSNSPFPLAAFPNTAAGLGIVVTRHGKEVTLIPESLREQGPLNFLAKLGITFDN